MDIWIQFLTLPLTDFAQGTQVFLVSVSSGINVVAGFR